MENRRYGESDNLGKGGTKKRKNGEREKEGTGEKEKARKGGEAGRQYRRK